MFGKIPALVRGAADVAPRAVVGVSHFGRLVYTTAAYPDRAYQGLDRAGRPESVRLSDAAIDVEPFPTPLETLLDGRIENLSQETRRSIARMEAMWLLVEDRHRLLDASRVEPLAHQASLVEHVLARPELRRVLIADEVGLGKTIEAALIVRSLVAATPDHPPKVLYLTGARLVGNVVEEFAKLGLRFRHWTADRPEALLGPEASDDLVVASIHRAAHQAKFDAVSRSGPWDVLIVDEAHHLTDYSADGNQGGRQMQLVRRLIEDRLAPGGRLLLLSGTPHQGHEDRYRNLLRLLDEDGKDEEAARGRVIYRIKEDVRNWEGNPFFPRRDVRPLTKVDLGRAYDAWLSSIHSLLAPSRESRAGDWRRSQALQWAASSPQAGLAYLVRLALRSASYSRRGSGALDDALAALRPYREGTPDEPIEVLRARIADADDLDVTDDPFRGAPEALDAVLSQGVALVRGNLLEVKLAKLFEWLEAAPAAKIVVFAQPVETGVRRPHP